VQLVAPPHWDKMGRDELVKKVDVQPGSPEFAQVQQIFLNYGPIPGTGRISRIIRIQNLGLWNK
jgi:hypothetical protein